MAIEKLIKAVIMGPPGSGKGTIANRIVKDFGMHHLASGDLLRKHVALKTDLGKTANEYITKGLLVPDKLTVDLIIREIAADKSGKHWLLDGFPRTISQCEELMKLHQLSVVINLDVPFDEIVNRVKDRYIHEPSGRIYNLVFSPPKKPGLDDVTGEPLIQRHDDKESTVRARLDTYQRQTSPLLEYFQQHKLLINFRGRYSNEIWPKVHKELCKFCTPLQYTHYS